MPKCIACDVDLQKSSEVVRGYCDECQVSIRTVFDKDAYALGQYKETKGSVDNNTLDWTNFLDKDI
jgi:ribosomal protein L7Ae-like RNA K-turn-binding protein